jgi:hypothetical protein
MTKKRTAPDAVTSEAKGQAYDYAAVHSKNQNQEQGAVTALRLALLANGYEPVPLRGKATYLPDWPNITITDEVVRAWATERKDDVNTGLRTRTTPAIDIDVLDQAVAEDLEAHLRGYFNSAAAGLWLRRVGLPPKRAFLFKTTIPFAKLWKIFTAPNGKLHKIEILGDGQQVAAYGIHPDTGQPYTWHGGEPRQVAKDELPTLDEASARAWLHAAAELLFARGWQLVSQSPTTAAGTHQPRESDEDLPELELVAAAVAAVSPTTDRDTRIAVGHEIKASVAAADLDEGFAFWRAWLERSGKIASDDEVYKRWCGFNPNRTGFGALYNRACDDTPDWLDRYDRDLQAKMRAANREGRRQQQQEDKSEQQQQKKEDAEEEFGARQYVFPKEATIPPRDWLYQYHLLRGAVALTAATGGTGKSNKSIAEALAMVTGKALLGGAAPRQLRVLLVNLEEDRAEMDRRIAAVMKRYNLKQEEVGGRLFIAAKGEVDIKAVVPWRRGTFIVDEAAVAILINYVKKHAIDVVSIDPLRKTHATNEIDPILMGMVIEYYERVASAGNCAVHIWHHMRKGNGAETTVEAVRGTSVLIDAPRSVDVMETMTSVSAKGLGIDEGHRQRYFCCYNGKRNYAPPAYDRDWFEIVSVTLENAFPFGDEVGVVIRWQPPDIVEIMTPGTIEIIKQAVGVTPRWRSSSQATMWVGKEIARVLNLDCNEKKDIIKMVVVNLIKIKVLKTIIARDEQRREDKEFVVAVLPPAAPTGAT